MVWIRLAGMPSATSAFFTAVARRLPSARLYSRVPRSSQWPSTVTVTLAYCFSHVAWRCSVCCPSDLMSEWSKSKNTRSPTFWTKSSREPLVTPLDDWLPAVLVAPVVSAEVLAFSLHAARRSTAAAIRLNDRRFIFLTPSQETWECAVIRLCGRRDPIGPRMMKPGWDADVCRGPAAGQNAAQYTFSLLGNQGGPSRI